MFTGLVLLLLIAAAVAFIPMGILFICKHLFKLPVTGSLNEWLAACGLVLILAGMMVR